MCKIKSFYSSAYLNHRILLDTDKRDCYRQMCILVHTIYWPNVKNVIIAYHNIHSIDCWRQTKYWNTQQKQTISNRLSHYKSVINLAKQLTLFGRVTHICACKPVYHRFRSCVFAKFQITWHKNNRMKRKFNWMCRPHEGSHFLSISIYWRGYSIPHLRRCCCKLRVHPITR